MPFDISIGEIFNVIITVLVVPLLKVLWQLSTQQQRLCIKMDNLLALYKDIGGEVKTLKEEIKQHKITQTGINAKFEAILDREA